MSGKPAPALRRAKEAPAPTRAPTWLRPSAAHVLIAIAALAAFTLNLIVLRGNTQTALVAVAAVAIQSGETIEESSIRHVEIAAGFEGIDSLFTSDQSGSLVGMVATRPLTAGTLIDRGSATEEAATGSLRAMSIPVFPERAAGGLVRTGDRVDVIVTDDGAARFVVTDVEVLGVASSASGGLGAATANFIILAVDSDQALALASALGSGSIEVVRSTGADPVRSSPIEGGDGP